jgi:sulfide:quinone oxidoreductase
VRLRDRGSGDVAVTLVTRDATATHLAGTVPAALGDRDPQDYVVSVAIANVDCRAGEVSAIDGGGATVDGGRIDADAVIAAPGLWAVPDAVPAWQRAHAAWDPVAAAAGSTALADVPGGRLLIAICSLPYRCPPAPYSLAMALADRHKRSGRFTKVCVATPEPFPLMAVGGEAPAFLMDACAGAGVEFEGRFEADLDASEDGVLRSRDGRELDYQHALLVPPHRRSPALDGLAGDGPLVTVDERGESATRGLFVVGDAAASGLPRAAAVAEAQGRTAADAVLARLGLGEARDPHLPEPSCYVLHAGGAVSRIRLRYPSGLPPDGEPQVAIDGPTPDLAHAAEGERRRFLRCATDAS